MHGWAILWRPWSVETRRVLYASRLLAEYCERVSTTAAHLRNGQPGGTGADEAVRRSDSTCRTVSHDTSAPSTGPPAPQRSPPPARPLPLPQRLVVIEIGAGARDR
jgi:hypothetical protein